MARKHEIATVFDNKPNVGLVANSSYRPDNAIAALMQCAPGQDPLPSSDEMLHLRDIIQDAIDKLTERERWIFDALFTRRLSCRACATELSLSKTHVLRLRDEITMKLRADLVEHAEIREYLA